MTGPEKRERCGGPDGKECFTREEARAALKARGPGASGKGHVYWCAWASTPHYHLTSKARKRKGKKA